MFGATSQRCKVHLARNILATVNLALKDMVADTTGRNSATLNGEVLPKEHEMSETELPAHLTAFLTDLQADPTLVQGAKAAVGELKNAAAVEAAAAYYQSKGYQISVEELTALEIARKQAVGEALSEHELETVAGGFSMWALEGSAGSWYW